MAAPGPPGPGSRFDWRRLRRSPRAAVGIAVLVAALLLWPFSGLSPIPWLIGFGALVLLRLLRLDGPLRGWDLPLAALVVLVGLMLSTGPWAWALAVGIGVLLAGLVRLPRWRVAAVGAVLCLISGIGFGFAAHQDRVELDQIQARSGDAARAVIAERSDAVLPAVLNALAQRLPDPQPICRLLTPDAERQLAAVTAAPACAEAVAVLHGRAAGRPVPDRDDLPVPGPGPTPGTLIIDACATAWGAAAGADLGRIELSPVSPVERTYEVSGFRPC